MAKCIKKDGEIKRLPENSKKELDIIDYHVRNGWSFISKKEWKTVVRGTEVKSEKKEKIKKDKK